MKNILENIVKKLINKFGNNIKCIILYGSYAKGTASRHSDIDLLLVLHSVDSKAHKKVNNIKKDEDAEIEITIVITNIEDFRKEKIPLYTAVKKEGKIIYGNIELSINPEPPAIKYADFLKKSYQFELHKIEIAEELIEKEIISSVPEFCFIASKHAIQAGLAKKGVGYSSKISVLMPLVEKYFGKAIVRAFRRLFELYIKSEYNIESITIKEAKSSIRDAKKILNVYIK